MVTVAVDGLPRVPFAGALNVTVKFSFPSKVESSVMGTVTSFDVSLGRNVISPALAV